ncbi:FRIGIDA-like protein 5 [Dorcoceras hygrometricum]|uniref:FRIGIDA-like protein 5 n=1 Tax=Dorcoceras hygrometricum TaxID=472368 RepID=A0A2Z7D233_9LAMI|nr:FRIGIDA-like protein 5 [Dorcoceras hygrometricum]
MTSSLLIGRNRESATMTSACLLEKVIISNYDVNNQQSIRSARSGSAMMTSAVMSLQSAVVKKRKSWISDDNISSDVITISSELQYSQSMVLEVGDCKTMSFG